jgi:hypothetical protein
MQQKLALCLDGTWNAQDSGTNIYHLSNLIVEGAVTKEGQTWHQLVYYQEGVGTGMLDRVTGGAFGIGLSRNVREAYDWLIEHYCDGDEIYIFGFSRGAFTARSLVGLISKCGLLRRGAPMPPEQLWHAYQILGRSCDSRSHMEPAKSWWERIWGKPKRPFRALQDLRRETWEKSPPLPLHKPANRAEELLVQWSRRVPIHCVGAFDTVGALGLNALAIPWVRDHTAQFHDARLTTLVTNGFQALAIDEHRKSFAHVPWYQETASSVPEGETSNGGRIEQRWFTGAHSNVGGGYEDDVLSQHALAWMIKETSSLGLEYRPIGKGDPNPAVPLPCQRCLPLQKAKKGEGNFADQAPTLRDSFSELAGGIWKHFIRAKREYRRIAPPPELQNGKMARSLNEKVDSSVSDFAQADRTYNPPNLWRYRKDREPGFSGKPPVHRYGDPSLRWWALLAVWLGLIALAGGKLGELLDGRLNNGGSVWSWRLALLAPLIAFLVDWRESVLNHQTALEPEGMAAEKRRAWMDWYLGIRLGAIAAAAAGIVIAVYYFGWVWLRLDLQHSNSLFWLLALAGLWIYFQAAMAWAGGPMTDAGLGSIVPLQLARTPEAVRERLAKWAGTYGEEGRSALMPVARSLWRDTLGFVPSYTLLLFVGSWLALSLYNSKLHLGPSESFFGILSRHDRFWMPVLLGALLCALADEIENWSERRYVRRFPAPPSPGAVYLAVAATCTKYLLFIVGLLLTVAATLTLAVLQMGQVIQERAGTLSVLVVFWALFLVFTAVKNLFFRKGANGQEPATHELKLKHAG